MTTRVRQPPHARGQPQRPGAPPEEQTRETKTRVSGRVRRVVDDERANKRRRLS